MKEPLKNLILGKRTCPRCKQAFRKREFGGDFICKNCQKKLKSSVKKPNAHWDVNRHMRRSGCPYCKSSRYKLIHEDRFDHTGNRYKCLRCRSRFMGYQLDDAYDKSYAEACKRRPRQQKGKNIALLKCCSCNRTFRQDNHKFQETGRCPSCRGFDFELLRYVPPRKVKK